MFPELRLSSTYTVSTYFLIISLSALVGSLWFVRRAERRHLERVIALDLTMVCLVAGFVGARLLHVIWEDPSYYISHPWAVLQVWNGGFVYLGGMVSAGVAALLFCQLRGEPFWFWADTAAPAAALSYALGRLACLANGCCYGRECRLPWSIHLHGLDRHPTQAYASLWEFGALGVLLWAEPRLKTSGVLFNAWLLTHAVGRILMELFRDDPRGEPLLGLSIGIWMSLGLAGFALFNIGGVILRKSD